MQLAACRIPTLYLRPWNCLLLPTKIASRKQYGILGETAESHIIKDMKEVGVVSYI